MNIAKIKCRLCGSDATLVKSDLLYLKKFNANLYQCNYCKMLQLDFVNWLDFAYSESISITDTGLVQRNIMLAKRVLVLLSVINLKNLFPVFLYRIFKKYLKIFAAKSIKPFKSKILDFGGGYGLLVRLLRDAGFDAYWNDLYTENLLAKGFEKNSGYYEVLLSFEVLEHLENPKFELDKIFKEFSPNFFITTTLSYGNEVPNENWWYYSFETGQHITFYNQETFNVIASIYGYHYFSVDETFHIFSKQKINKELIRFYVQRSDFFYDTFARKYNSLTLTDHDRMLERIKLS
ncbi:class I SAM-dependent methyltransferase [Leptospira bouyouniensis]|uniref:class I SAM-dependent methyltransferase n=1 Tax=Leptospira bouyouniensis TaxID=2484911 RepID=UPI001FC9EE5F|nr:class I SAM-dependent methyltransferase [Leptospira bouyouniensis]